VKKYLYCFKIYFLDSFNYRFNAVVNLAFGGIGMLITLVFWHLIYAGDTDKVLNGFTFSGIATYFIIGSVFRSYNYPGFMYSGLIKSGQLGPVLLKPQHLGVSLYFRNLAGLVTGSIPQAVLVLCALPFAARFLTWNLNVQSAFFMLAFFVVGTISNFLVWSLAGYMAFWMEEADAVMWSFAVLCNFLTGMFLPLAFFPRRFVALLELLPFASWSYIPVNIYIGLYDMDKILFLLAAHAAWVGALALINKAVWDGGVKRFTSVGG